jgi:hypothetical protein
MTMHKVLDAAYPPATAPAGISGVMGYLGGIRALHAWTPAEWQPFAHVRQFGLYVPDTSADPYAQGSDAVNIALSLGWSDKMIGTQQRAIIIDLETSTDRTWYDAIANRIGSKGFMPVAYGSLSTVLLNAANDVLVAEFDDVPVIPSGQDIHGVQFLANQKLGSTTVDYSVFDDWLYYRGGVGARHILAA